MGKSIYSAFVLSLRAR